ncbi:MAG TPA: ATP-binding protein [Baekduia sp.]|nr:ATP-binding protein [Baekduia sp.]
MAIIALLVPLAFSLADRVDGEVRSQASNGAALLATAAGQEAALRAPGAVSALARATADRLSGRVVVVDGAGRVVADSAGAAGRGTSYASRPEIAAALRGRAFQGVRHSDSLATDLLVTATPIVRGGAVMGAVRVTQAVGAVQRAVRTTVLELALVAAIVLAMGLLAGALLARRIARPVLELERTARDVAHGDLAARADEQGSREQRSLARSFNQMTDRLTALVEAQRRFVADASHQLRTPLTGLRLRLESLAARRTPPAPGEVDAALAEVDRLAAIVEGLLELSRGGERARPGERCDLAGAVRAAAARFAPAAAEAGVQLRVVAGGADAPAVGWCPPDDLARALDALVENALRYGGGGVVEVAADPGLIEVRDRGPGPAPGEEEAVFDRFHRGSAARGGQPGTGLGLPVARALARGWGGEATLRARPGGGAVAALAIPAAPAAEAPGGAGQRAEVPA